jgi:hypothetical protein
LAESPVTGRDSSDEGLDSAQIAEVGNVLQDRPSFSPEEAIAALRALN